MSGPIVDVLVDTDDGSTPGQRCCDIVESHSELLTTDARGLLQRLCFDNVWTCTRTGFCGQTVRPLVDHLSRGQSSVVMLVGESATRATQWQQAVEWSANRIFNLLEPAAHSQAAAVRATHMCLRAGGDVVDMLRGHAGWDAQYDGVPLHNGSRVAELLAPAGSGPRDGVSIFSLILERRPTPDPAILKKARALTKVFNKYARQPPKARSQRSFAAISRDSARMSFPEFAQFATEFSLVPAILKMDELKQVWLLVNRGLPAHSAAGISCRKFVQCLDQIVPQIPTQMYDSEHATTLRELLWIGKQRYTTLCTKMSFVNLGAADALHQGGASSALLQCIGINLQDTAVHQQSEVANPYSDLLRDEPREIATPLVAVLSVHVSRMHCEVDSSLGLLKFAHSVYQSTRGSEHTARSTLHPDNLSHFDSQVGSSLVAAATHNNTAAIHDNTAAIHDNTAATSSLEDSIGEAAWLQVVVALVLCGRPLNWGLCAGMWGVTQHSPIANIRGIPIALQPIVAELGCQDEALLMSAEPTGRSAASRSAEPAQYCRSDEAAVRQLTRQLDEARSKEQVVIGW